MFFKILYAQKTSISINFYLQLSHKKSKNSQIRKFEWGSVKCRLQTDCGLLFLGLEHNGTIVVTF